LNCTGVAESSWAFKNTFSITEEELAMPNVDLVFEGVDTFAAITLVSKLFKAPRFHSLTIIL
jgi:hypothetical protein